MQLIENIVMFAIFISNFIVYMLNWDKEKKYLFSCIITIIGFSLYLVSKFSVTTGLIIILMGGIGIVYYQNNSEGSLDGKRIDFFLRWTITEKVTRNFIYIGISIIFLVLSFEFLYGNNAIGQSSTLVLIFSLVLLLYDFIPDNFWRERDFVLLFFSIMLIIIVIPSLADDILIKFGIFEAYNFDNSFFISNFLAKPLIALLNILGYDFFSSGDRIYFQDLEAGITSSVWIARSCSGYYSIVIFISAYVSYIMSNTSKINFEIFLSIILGILIAYIANLFRMVIIILAGHYWGGDALIWTHANVGWLIFTLWLAIFWPFLTRAVDGKSH